MSKYKTICIRDGMNTTIHTSLSLIFDSSWGVKMSGVKFHPYRSGIGTMTVEIFWDVPSVANLSTCVHKQPRPRTCIQVEAVDALH